MVQIVHGLLVLEDGRIIFQRRTKDAKYNPGMLGFFGGHIEKDEPPSLALRRELQEETSLDVEELEFKPVSSYTISKDVLNTEDDRSFHLFRVEVPTEHFDVYEGDGAEAYTKAEALTQSDLIESVRYALEKIVKQ